MPPIHPTQPSATRPPDLRQVAQQQHCRTPQDEQHADADLECQRIDPAQQCHAQRHAEHAPRNKRPEKRRLPGAAQDAGRRNLTAKRPEYDERCKQGPDRAPTPRC
jgi:hypothetical protein